MKSKMQFSKGNKPSTNILYLGMADDIITPFMLVPHLDVLYIIDWFDEAFSKDMTSEGY